MTKYDPLLMEAAGCANSEEYSIYLEAYRPDNTNVVQLDVQDVAVCSGLVAIGVMESGAIGSLSGLCLSQYYSYTTRIFLEPVFRGMQNRKSRQG